MWLFLCDCAHTTIKTNANTHTEGQGERDIDRRVDGQELTAIISHYTGLCNEVKCANNAIKCSLLFCIQKKCFRIGILTHSHTRTRIQYIYNREKSTLIGEKSEQKKLEITFHVLCVARFDEKEAQWSSVFAHTHIQTKNWEKITIYKKGRKKSWEQ